MKKLILSLLVLITLKSIAQPYTVAELLENEKVINFFLIQKNILDRFNAAYSNAQTSDIPDSTEHLKNRFDTLISRGENLSWGEANEFRTRLNFNSFQEFFDKIDSFFLFWAQVQLEYEMSEDFADSLGLANRVYENFVVTGGGGCVQDRINCEAGNFIVYNLFINSCMQNNCSHCENAIGCLMGCVGGCIANGLNNLAYMNNYCLRQYNLCVLS